MMSLIDIQNLTIKNTSEKSLIKGIDLKIFSQQINAFIQKNWCKHFHISYLRMR